jgi:hAT family C-terminal dimerisation region
MSTSTLTTASTSSVSVRSSPVKARPSTRFKIERSSYDIAPKRQHLSVNAEYAKYSLGDRCLENPDILHFWEVGKSIIEWCDNSRSEKVNRAEFPTLYAMAMDYLPVQATSVPCERVFSSAKETDTAKRNRISPVLMEALQLFKFSLKKERLNFTDGWSTSESAMRENPAPSHDTLDTLLKGDEDTALDAVLKDFLTDDDENEE